MTDLQQISFPLTPPDCDLRDFNFMPLDVVALRDSDIAALSTGEEFRAAILLICASWHQIPAASLPNDDAILAQLSGFGRVVREFQKVKTGALSGWILCNDGRFYHPTISEKAHEAWARRVEFRRKKEADRLRKATDRARQIEDHVQRTNANCPTDKQEVSSGHDNTNDAFSVGIPAENALTGIGIGIGTVIVASGEATPQRVASNAKSQIEFDAEQGLFLNISDEQMAAWHEAFPKLNIDAELNRAEAWYIANPRRRKQNHHRFLVNWFARDHDRLHPGGVKMSGPEAR